MLSLRLIRTALAFFVTSTLLGIYMGAAQDFRFVHVHVHLHLLGWVSLGLIGIIYHLHPQLQTSRLAHVQYWLHTVGLVVFMGAFAWGSAVRQLPAALVGLGASAVMLAVLVLAYHLTINLRLPRMAPSTRQPEP